MSPSIFGHKMTTFNNKDRMLSHSNQGWGRRGEGATSHNLGQSSVVAAHSQTICYGQGNTIGQDWSKLDLFWDKGEVSST